jgi:hypothetical protein
MTLSSLDTAIVAPDVGDKRREDECYKEYGVRAPYSDEPAKPPADEAANQVKKAA